jgi:hypothetical protein
MANWRYTLDVKDAWQQTKAGEMIVAAFAAHAVKQIDALGIEDDERLLEIVDELSDIAQSDDADVQWLDRVWKSLYDWADQVVGSWDDKMCWIKTF